MNTGISIKPLPKPAGFLLGPNLVRFFVQLGQPAGFAAGMRARDEHVFFPRQHAFFENWPEFSASRSDYGHTPSVPFDGDPVRPKHEHVHESALRVFIQNVRIACEKT